MLRKEGRKEGKKERRKDRLSWLMLMEVQDLVMVSLGEFLEAVYLSVFSSSFKTARI
jgi:hypothetical protein